MTDSFLTPEELDSNNSIENNNSKKLQNKSEESTKNENVEKQKPKHFSGFFDITPGEEEEERRRQEEDRELWERINEEDETNSAGSGEENVERANEKDSGKDDEKTDVGEQLNQSTGRRHFRKDNRRIADLKRTKTQKEKKSERLQSEIDSHLADIDRGYLIVKLGDDSERAKHVQLEVSDKAIIKSVISEKEYEKFELSLDISEIDSKIRELAAAKRSSYKDRLSKKKAGKIENDLVKRVVKELGEASMNGGKEIVSNIHQQVQSGKKDVAYDSLKFFLSQQVKPVAKKLFKDAKLEKNVLDKVIEKLNTSQS
ncbi:MAG TPA: hypothetical protein PKA80_11865 [Ignavibacteriaceae bacterium]|nr:hypothetical protein [Ignavibacteriaceae bacterium]